MALSHWALLFSVTAVCTTTLMVIGTYFACLKQATQYFNVSRTKVLLFSNIFNFTFIAIVPFVFLQIHKYYYKITFSAVILIFVCLISRWISETNYIPAMISVALMAVGNITLLTAPYGLLHLFSQHLIPYVLIIPLYIPALGLNFTTFYGRQFIVQNPNFSYQIRNLNNIITVFGSIACLFTLFFYYFHKEQIQNQSQQSTNQLPQVPYQDIQKLSLCQVVSKIIQNKPLLYNGIGWGWLLGLTWTYGSLFGVIFEGQHLTPKQVDLIGIAQISAIIFSSLGTFIRDNTSLHRNHVIFGLNIIGVVASASIWFLHGKNAPLALLIVIIVLLRAGYTAFTALAFEHMNNLGLPPIVVSSFFFWIANVVNQIFMQTVDLLPITLNHMLITITAILAVLLAYYGVHLSNLSNLSN